jgi:hypothetical protein
MSPVGPTEALPGPAELKRVLLDSGLRPMLRREFIGGSEKKS